jgi:hypothetical protein
MKTTHVLKILNGSGGDRPDSDFEQKWLEIGTEIELEHTTRRDVAKIICKQHLTEFPFYYFYLQQLEEEMTRDMELRRAMGIWVPYGVGK